MHMGVYASYIHNCSFIYIYIYICTHPSTLLLHIITNPYIRVIEECNFSIQLEVQYGLALWRLKLEFIKIKHGNIHESPSLYNESI